ncbi:GNAT family N-acetyltransferase [Halostagnicola kamekurae]|uniref:Acetyltransferase (GNAT) domain-containing protein n=1 Tax=Halostagnicola kamekurae TaxID=619731 RepID=A0A1I6UHA5_9EURY|nr:GNAT family N-acetyltransferase [Halostagnicola kamekurae]SFT00754.1 Acetyltransferase (GNAT) domain-containing protein [Halostagnicola kamekurae]
MASNDPQTDEQDETANTGTDRVAGGSIESDDGRGDRDERRGRENQATDDRTTGRSDRETASEDGDDDPYEIRLYEPSDRAGFLELYDLVFGDVDGEWFRWKYEDNPYVDHVPIVLATHEGSIVGTKPCFVLELRADSKTFRGYQPADVMVHPDHRRRGLYSRTTERMKEYYRARDPELFFNFPNPATLSGSLKHGWEIVERVPTYYRIQRPESMLEMTESERVATLTSVATPVVERYLDAQTPRESGVRGVSVERYDEVPAEVFAEIYRRAIPGTIHANRNETFYEWRFENPTRSYEAYVARKRGEAIAGIVTGTAIEDGSRITNLTDVVPLATTADRRDGIRALLSRIVDDRRDDAILAVSGDGIPESILSEFGFYSDLAVPLSHVSQPTTQVTYPISSEGGHEWTVGGRAVADAANWTITFAEQDTR